MADHPPVNLGWPCDRQKALRAIYVLGAEACCYSTGGRWADRCDCKYGLGERGRRGSEVNGCPELRTLYGVVAGMTDTQWKACYRLAEVAVMASEIWGD